MTVVHKSADEANSTTTLDDVDDMALPVEANLEYQFEFLIPFKSAGSLNGIGLAVSSPTLDGTAFIAYTAESPITSTEGSGAIGHGFGTSSDDVVQFSAVGFTDTVVMARVYGILKNGSNAGNLQLRFKSEAAGTAVTIMQGAVGKLYPKNV